MQTNIYICMHILVWMTLSMLCHTVLECVYHCMHNQPQAVQGQAVRCEMGLVRLTLVVYACVCISNQSQPEQTPHVPQQPCPCIHLLVSV